MGPCLPLSLQPAFCSVQLLLCLQPLGGHLGQNLPDFFLLTYPGLCGSWVFQSKHQSWSGEGVLEGGVCGRKVHLPPSIRLRFRAHWSPR